MTTGKRFCRHLENWWTRAHAWPGNGDLDTDIAPIDRYAVFFTQSVRNLSFITLVCRYK